MVPSFGEFGYSAPKEYRTHTNHQNLFGHALGPTPTMGPVANIPLWLCFAVAAGFAAFGMNMALRAFQKAIK